MAIPGSQTPRSSEPDPFGLAVRPVGGDQGLGPHGAGPEGEARPLLIAEGDIAALPLQGPQGPGGQDSGEEPGVTIIGAHNFLGCFLAHIPYPANRLSALAKASATARRQRASPIG